LLNQAQQDLADQLFTRYGRGVGSYVLSQVRDADVAEEITGRVFLTMVRRFEQCRGAYAGWLWSIVRSELSRHWRARSSDRPLDDLQPARTEGPVDSLMREETSTQLHGAIARLPEHEQRLLSMKFFLEMKNVEIAAATHMSPANVGVSIHRALKRLRRVLESKDVAPVGGGLPGHADASHPTALPRQR
jgi:RNA polymerase sigma-70 factor (ECF subfamily)